MFNKSIIGPVCACLALVVFTANAASTWVLKGVFTSHTNIINDLESINKRQQYARFTLGLFMAAFLYGNTAFAALTYEFDVRAPGSFGNLDGRIEISVPFGSWTATTPGDFNSILIYIDGSPVELLNEPASYVVTPILSNDGYRIDHGIFDTFTYPPTDDYYELIFDVAPGLDRISYYAGGFGTTLTAQAWGDWNVVPIPPAAWLFGSGLLGLIGVARRKKV